ncbi:S8 family serine peptidase [Evansella sp. AB-P1]|uniref:S8 family serine peptidase n=1 Tax=Evansella sp. AB-P1 TaxID=3037653 RepID=UPI00241EE886|nr:S8 family serine peptidase [Evansella sp. AB-P1]MDG5787727.1 S8 family serine peptidase [Evansella sp. AB-P1]
MKGFFNKVLVFTLTFLLLFVTGFSSVGLANNGSIDQLGKLYGNYDNTSSSLTTVIVELHEPSIVEAKHSGKSQSKSRLSSVRNQVIQDINNVVSSSAVHREYDYLFSGFAVELPENEVRNLITVPGIEAVYPNITYEATASEPTFIENYEFSPTMMESAPFIGANDAWDLGYTGKGVTVAVIDTGVDYTHPDLVHAFGDNKGWDFVDNNDDPQETGADDPRGDSTNHGTHVAGTIAADGEIKGVAPDATLLAYRVLGPGGSGTTDNVLAGIERAVQDGADVMNLSLGNTSNDPDFATSLALDWAMAEGVVAVTSNGNSGPNRWTVGSPGTSRDAISVGATRLPYNVFHVELNTSGSFEYQSANVMGHPSDEELLALDGEEFEFVFVELGLEEDFDDVDVDGKIALIERGEIPFVEKAENAKDAGAIGAIIFNNVEGVQPDVPGMVIPTIKISNEDGEKMLAELVAGNNTVSFAIEDAGIVDETVADFSSRGPVLGTWMIKPDVVAPGVNIVSTIPTHNPDNPYGYAAFQGTSMSAPHVAGAVALLLEKYPDWTPEEIKSALMNTAESIYDEIGNVYPLNTQGAGSIRIVDALNIKTLVAPGSYSYGVFMKDNGRQVERQHFEIKNLSNEIKRYSMEVNFYDGAEHIQVNTSNNLEVKPGKIQKVNMNVQVNASELDWGFYEGMITLTHEDEVIEIPTILFIGDPTLDDHLVPDHLEAGSFTLEDGVFDISLLLNRDVDYAEIYFYFADLSGGYFITEFFDLPEGQVNLTLDASGIFPLIPAGEYALVTFIGDENWEEGWVLGYFTVE